MKPATVQFRKRSCHNKKRYRSHQQAVRMQHKILNGRGVKLGSYPCEVCGGWHLYTVVG